jgi:hypothetical protein
LILNLRKVGGQYFRISPPELSEFERFTKTRAAPWHEKETADTLQTALPAFASA